MTSAWSAWKFNALAEAAVMIEGIGIKPDDLRPSLPEVPLWPLQAEERPHQTDSRKTSLLSGRREGHFDGQNQPLVPNVENQKLRADWRSNRPIHESKGACARAGGEFSYSSLCYRFVPAALTKAPIKAPWW